MSRSLRIRHIVLPIGVAFLSCVSAIVAVVANRVKDSNSLELNAWDYSAVIGAIATAGLALAYVLFDYREKREAARLLTVRLALRGLKQMPPTLNTWVKDERYVACVLSVWIDGNDLPPVRLFEVVLRYGQLTSPESPGEYVHERILARDDWDNLLARSGLYLLVEPTDGSSAAKTSALYDRDNLKENLYDTEGLDLPHPEHSQLLVVTPGLKEKTQKFLGDFMYPNEVQIVVTHGYSHGRRGLPVLFDVVSAIELDLVGKGHVTGVIDEINSVHEFAIMATHYPGESLTKRLLHHSAQLRLRPSEASLKKHALSD